MVFRSLWRGLHPLGHRTHVSGLLHPGSCRYLGLRGARHGLLRHASLLCVASRTGRAELGDGDADMHELFLSNFFAQTKALEAQDQSTRALIEYYRANRTK